jgi:hypothetical protein
MHMMPLKVTIIAPGRLREAIHVMRPDLLQDPSLLVRFQWRYRLDRAPLHWL